MNHSAITFKNVERLRRVSPAMAVAAANLVGRGRTFSVDADGDWIHRQGSTAFASPDVHAKRLSLIQEATRDEFLWRYTPKAEDIVFDVGAGVGEEAVALAPHVAHIYAIEAHPVTYRCLAKTISMSGLKNVTPIFCALSDADGELRISTGANHLANSIGDDGDIVPARSLASLCAELGISRVDFLKMNIEGAERLAVQGFGEVPIINMAISCHDFVADTTGDEGFRTKSEVLQFLNSHGYTVETRSDHERLWTRHMLYAR